MIIITMSDSILYLHLTGNKGTVQINESIPQSTVFRLSKVNITFASSSDSATCGSLVNVDVGLFNSTIVNSNRTNSITSLPLFNDITKQVSGYTLNLPIGITNDISQTFTYRITKLDGSLVSNLTSVQIVLAYRA